MGKYDVLAKEIKRGDPTVLQVIQLHSTYKTASESNKSMILEKLNEIVEHGNMAQDQTFALVAAEMYLAAGEMKSALKMVYKGSTLDMMAMTVQILLSVNRLDLAEQHLRKMVEIDEDDTLTQLAQAWTNMAKGGSNKVSEALDIYQDLQEKFGSSILVLNSIAVCQITQQQYADALSSLGAARDLARKMNIKISPDTYVNTLICLKHLRKSPSMIASILSDFKKNSPKDPWILKQQEMLASLEKSKKTYA
eukprot:CAMPEP_0167757734 /NCGR_PEP_ID=MMETSP0110_2-20121227/10087_1 /TAXON_ID=629695 /ORGANISM="Gymnochlora sp., Strain CCMP2014" /LENGTH=250 /DNA_ID=CAMNT_0007643951 /DNA_START=174 /DNA_END=926 /DNA_ORIENTATION=-